MDLWEIRTDTETPRTIMEKYFLKAPAVEVKQRKRPEEYWFSTEIRVQCKYTVRDGKKVAIVSYRPLLHTIQKRLEHQEYAEKP